MSSRWLWTPLKQSLDGGEKTIILGENSPLAQILLNP